MAKKKYKNNYIPAKNYVIAILVIIGLFLVGIYAYKWYCVKEDKKYLDSYLVSTNTINLEMISLDEIESVLSEPPTYYFIYVSFTKSKSNYNYEKKLQPIIKEYNLIDNFYFMNVTDIKTKNSNYIKDLEKKLNIQEGTIKDVPVILYFKDKELANPEGIYSAEEFKNLLESRNIKSM